MARIFISYSRADEAFARQLAASLSQLGADVWIDIEDIPGGMKWSTAIQEGLDVSDVLLIVITPKSMASRNVEDEWQYYLDQKKPVIPLLLLPAKVHFQLSRIQYIDFHKQDYDTAFKQLYSELRRKGVALEALSLDGNDAIPQQSPLPVREDGRKGGTIPMTWIAAGAAVVLIGIIAFLILSNQPPLTPTKTPTPSTQIAGINSPLPEATETPAPSNTPSLTFTPSNTPSPTATYSATEEKQTLDAMMLELGTQDIQTRDAEIAKTASHWTATPTPDLRATARALQTATQNAAIAAATQAQNVIDQTATATLWTATPTITPTPTATQIGGGRGQIAYASGTDASGYDIYLMDADGKNPHLFTTNVSSDTLVSWSSDGKKLAYTAAGNIYIVDEQGNRINEISHDGNNYFLDPIWSPDGLRLGVSSTSPTYGTRDIFIMDANGGNRVQVTNRHSEDRRVSWSPDGKTIAFQSDRDGKFSLYLVDSNCLSTTACEDNIRALRSNGNLVAGSFPAWSPDGKQIAFHVPQTAGGYQIKVINVADGQIVTLVENPSFNVRPAWSSDGTRIVFFSNRDSDAYEIYSVDTTTHAETRLTNNNVRDLNPVWRPG